MDKDFVTQEQIEKARSVDLLDYVKRTEPNNIERCGQDEYRLKDHDSLVISNGKFNWFSRGIGGSNAIDFLVKVRGVEFRDAVRELAGESFTYTADKRAPPNVPKREPASKQDYVPFFELPQANDHNDDVIQYLKGRGMEESVINACIEGKLLYQAKAYRKPLYFIEDGDKKPLYDDVDEKKHRHESIKGGCIFVGYDNQQNPKFACERATDSDFKKDVFGSNKAYSFCMPPVSSDSNRVYVFEGVIDCISHASIAQIGGTDWDGHRLSLGGVSAVALKTFLENNPQVTQVYLGLDNDAPGKNATERIIKEVLENDSLNHVNIYVAPPPVGKDYNDTLLFMQAQIKERKLQSEKQSDINTAHETPKPPIGKKRSVAVL